MGVDYCGLITRCVVPSHHGVLSFSTTCPAGVLVEVEARREADVLAITVADRGPGLSEAQRSPEPGAHRVLELSDTQSGNP